MTWILGVSSALGIALWLLEKLSHAHTKADLKEARGEFSAQQNERIRLEKRVEDLEKVIKKKGGEIEILEAAVLASATPQSVRDQLGRVFGSQGESDAELLPGEPSP